MKVAVQNARGHQGPRALLATWTAFVAWALAAIYFANGLTRFDASARVDVSPQSPSPDIANGWLDAATGQAVVHVIGAPSLADRSLLRLGLVTTLIALGLACMGVANLFAARTASAEQGSVRVRLRGWRLLAVAMLCAGLVVPFAMWVQAGVVLDLAGGPVGLTPPGSVQWPWIAGGLLCAFEARRLRRNADPVG